jgi:tRNA pseudouridine38-40 synthase
MPRYKLTIEYDGTPYVGWQAQDNGISVQGALTDAIAAFAGERVAVQGAGRTDTGVHALGQVAHIDLAKDWDIDRVRDAINFHLRPQPVAVLARACGRAGGAGLRCALLRGQAALPLSYRQSARRSRARP